MDESHVNTVESPPVRHEAPHGRLRWVVISGVIIALSVLIAQLASLWTLHDMEGETGPSAVSPQVPHGPLPPEPRLEEVDRLEAGQSHYAPYEVAAAVQEADRQRLNQYGWVDRKAGLVHIPIGEAIKILAARQTQKEKQP